MCSCWKLHPIFVDFICCASHSDSAPQLCNIVGFVVEPIWIESTFYPPSKSFHKPRRLVSSTAAAAILAAKEALEEIAQLCRRLEVLLELKLFLLVLVETKNLYHFSSPRRCGTDKSLQSDVNSVRYYYETEDSIVGWIPRFLNPAGAGTNLNSPVVGHFALILASSE